jgi:hypothetical protein
MEEIKAPKKERKFLKAVGNIAKVLANELVMGIARKFIGKAIDKVGNKRQGLVIAFALVAGISYASIDSIPYPVTGNKQRLGWQTSGNGLVYRGRSNDTITKPSSYVDKNVKAYLLLDSVRGTIFVWRQTYWDSILVGGGSGTFAQPIDSLFFDTSVPTNNVDTAKMRWDSDLATVVLGMYDNVPNELGFKNFWLVKNQTGSTITKGSLVYANGTVGASGRITVAKFIANGSIDAKYLLGITAHDLTDGEDGYVISFGKIRQVNTDTFAAGAILYPSPTVAGVWTDVEPVAPNLDMPIGFCINSSSNNGTIAIRVASGYKLSELHDVAISSPVDKASLYYSGGLWRDTTATLLVSDTAAMLANYATKEYADTTGRLYARQDFTNVSSSTLTWTQTDTLIPGGVNVVQVYRNGQILLPTQYTIPTSTSVVIAASSFKVNDNYTVIFPRGGGAGSGGGSGSLTSISGGTGILVSPNPITTTGTVSADLSVLMELTDTSLLNLTTRFASKLNTTDTASLSSRIDAKGNGTVTSIATAYGLTGGTITTTGTLRVDSNTVYNYVRDSIVKVRIGNDTIKILKQEYNNVTSDTLVWTTTIKFPIQLRAYILLFRNGQLLINDQYSIIDTNKVKVAATSYKIGENYTLVTVSGIGSAGVSQTGNPVYPEAGIALSTGTTWTTSITNNSTNWNTAYTDRLKWDGGSTSLVAATGRTSLGGTTIGQSMFTLTNPSTISFPRFNGDNTITARSAANFRNDIGAGTVTSVNIASGTPMSITNNTTTPEISMAAATGSVNGYLTSTDWTTFNSKQAALSGLGFIKANGTTITYDNSTYLTTSSASTTYLAKTDTAAMLLPYFRDADTTTLNLTSRFASKLNISDTAAMLSNYNSRINSKLNISDTLSMLSPYFKDADTSLLNLTSRFNTKLNLSDTLNMLVPYLRKADTTNMLSPYFRDADTSLLNLTSRFSAKLNISDTASMLTNYLRTGVAASTYLPLTGGTTGTTGSFITKLTAGNVGGGSGSPIFTAGLSGTETEFHIYQGTGYEGSPTTLRLTNNNGGFYQNGLFLKSIMERGLDEYNGRIGIMGTDFMILTKNNRIGIFNPSPSATLDVNGTLNATGATTLGSTLAVTGNITEGGNNVLTNLDTVSLSNRIDAKYNSTGGTISGKAILNDSARFEGNVLFKKNMGLPIVKISNADYTATTANHTIIYTVLTADKTLTIPNASDAIGIKYIISIFDIPEGNEALTLVTPSSNLFVRTDGESSNVDIVGGYCTTIQSDGTKWYILSYAPMY